MYNDPQADFAGAALRIILGQVGDTPRAPMKGFPDATNAVILNKGQWGWPHVVTIFLMTHYSTPWPVKTIILRLPHRNKQHSGARGEEGPQKDEGLNSSRWSWLLLGSAGLSSGNFTLRITGSSRARPITPWCAISDLESPASMHSPGQTRGTPACGLSSLVTCTHSAMWTGSDYVPRETRYGGLSGRWGGLGGGGWGEWGHLKMKK